jgi:acyl-CoA reductase-like NAD-dependent aldehyde dehydrogenase
MTDAFALESSYPLYVANEAKQGRSQLEVIDKYSGECVSTVALGDQQTIEEAIESACSARVAMARVKPFERQAILNHCVSRFEQNRDELAMTLCIEAGKPIKDSKGEVQRLIDTFRVAAEESVRIDGHIPNLEISARASDYYGFVRRYPIGVCAFITPFNFPLNLVAHKIAPAIASGCPFILKPAGRTPISALLVGAILAETDLPKGAFSIIPSIRDAADALTTDERIKLLSFTGSASVGWELKKRCGKKKIVLELGGNAACIVHKDSDISHVTERLVFGAFYQSGQSCISVQRILVHRSVMENVKSELVAKVAKLKCGDPRSPDTDIGPVISNDDANRLEAWIRDAVKAGAKILCGGTRSGNIVAPTLLENVPRELPLCAEEAFGPVAILSSYDDFSEAIKQANDSRYGLQAGLFTNDLRYMMQAWEELEVGGVIVNDVPSWRVDNMPYGGVKDSGLGREGIRSSIEDMTEPRLLVVRNSTSKS